MIAPRVEKGQFRDIQSEGNETMPTVFCQTCSRGHRGDTPQRFYRLHPELAQDNDPGMRARDINGKRHRVILFAQDKLIAIAGGTKKLSPINQQYELKADVAEAVSQFSPAEQRMVFRVLVQGQSIDKAAKGSKFSTSYWAHRLATFIIPRLKGALADYNEKGKLVLA